MVQSVKEALGAAYSKCVPMARLLVPMNSQKVDQCVLPFWIICISTSLISSGSGVSIVLIL